MNYFIANCNLYERNEITASFVVKKQFKDNGAEGLAFIKTSSTDNMDLIHKKIEDIVFEQRNGGVDSSTKSMDIFNKIPRALSKFVIRRIMWLDRHGMVPNTFIDSDPYYSSVVLSNLGSIGMHSGYHHLTNWGTNSLFVAVGEIKERQLRDKDGKIKTCNTVDLGLTIDERIADGYYYSKSIKLLKYILEHPEELDKDLGSKIKFD